MQDQLNLFFDLETTGCKNMSVFSKWNRTVQIACKSPEKSFQSFVNPEMKIPPWSSHIHGIFDEHVCDSPTIQTVFEQICTFFQFQTYRTVLMISYNGSFFDEIILRSQIEVPPNVTFMDPLPFIRRHYKFTSYRLADVYTQLTHNEPLVCHRADSDVLMLEAIAQHVKPKRIPPSGHLSDIKYIGASRKKMIEKKAHVFNTYDLKRKFTTLDAMDRFLENQIYVDDPTQRCYILAQLFSIEEVLRLQKRDFFNQADYYLFVQNEQPANYNSLCYLQGLALLATKT